MSKLSIYRWDFNGYNEPLDPRYIEYKAGPLEFSIGGDIVVSYYLLPGTVLWIKVV